MRHLRRISPFWFISLVLLAVYLWTWTESISLSLRVVDGQCTAALYGRSTTIDCPGLDGGSLAAIFGKSDPPLGQGRGLLERLSPKSTWTQLIIRDSGGRALRAGGPLPAEFEVEGTLRRPNEPGGIVLLLPDSDDGWAFLPDGSTRRGVWWTWRDGEPSAPMQGIPMDKPLPAQAQSFLRLLLDSWQGAVVLFTSAWLVAWCIRQLTTRIITLRHRPRRVPGILAIILPVLFTFAVALHVAVDVLERIPHVQDSVTYLFQAQTLARGELTAPAPPLAEPERTPHFDQEFLLVRDGRWFGKYPPGYPAVLALGVLANAHWLVNPLLAALTVSLIYVLARLAGRRPPARASAVGQRATNHSPERAAPPTSNPLETANWTLLLLATSPFFLIMSGSLMAHSAELFWTALFMVAWARAIHHQGRRWAVAAGLAMGMLFLTRQFTALTVGLSFGVGLMVLYWWTARRDQPGLRPMLHLRAPALRLLLFAAPFVLVLLGYQAALTGNPFTDPRLLYWPYDRVGFGPGYGESQNVFAFVPTNVGPAQVWYDDPAQPPRGNSPSLGLYNLGRNLGALHESLFAWPPLLTLSFVWLAFLLRRPSAADWALLLVAVAVAGGYIGFWAAGIAYGPRYFYAALPSLVILSARGIGALATATDRRVATVVVLALAAYGLASLPSTIEQYRGYNFVNAQERVAIEARVERPALVLATVSETDWWEYGSLFSGNTPWLDGEVIYARDLGPDENERLRAAYPSRRAYLWRDNRLTLLEP
jgi:hypothetical protein